MNQYGLAADGRTITLRRFDGITLTKASPAPIQLLIIDTETTGFDREKDKIIELGYVRAHLTPDNQVRPYEVGAWLNDPGIPIPEAATRITGIENHHVLRQSIDWKKVASVSLAADYIIAHNAAFDRAFWARECMAAAGSLWLCTWKQIPWKDRGHPAGSLHSLSHDYGYFMPDHHRALQDAEFLTHLLSQESAPGITVIEELITDINKTYYTVFAYRAAYKHREKLKAAGFYWDARQRVWRKQVASEEEIQSAEAAARLAGGQPATTALSAYERFSDG